MADTFITLDTTNLRAVAKHLRKVAPELARELGREIKAAGDLIAAEGKARSSWSANIPATIKVQRRGIGVKIVAGAGQKPHESEAHAFEHDGEGGTFRHPVFGNRDVWVDQAARPFLGPAFLAGQDAALNRIVAAIDRLIDKL